MEKSNRQFFIYVLLICKIIVFSCNIAHSQAKVENFPVQFAQITTSYSLTNPASIGVKPHNEAIMGFQQPLSGLKGVSTNFFTFSFTPYASKSAILRMNTLGLRLYTDREGAYIRRTRFYGMYAFHTRITKKIKFSGGIDFGAINYLIKSTPTTGSTSNYSFDANSGIWIYSTKFHVGLSLNQLTRSDLKPIEEITTLPLHSNFSASYELIKSDFLVLRPHILITYPYYSKLSIRGCLHAIIGKKVLTEIGLKYRENVSFVLGVNEFGLLKSKLNLAVSYTLQTQKISYGINVLEASVSWLF
jgi:type IX secretion system PorP/SprF family membrane protein